MWEMWFIKFNYERNLFTLQSRLGEVFGRSDTALSSCRKEKGNHIKSLQWHYRKESHMSVWDDRYVKFNDIVNSYSVFGTLETF